MLPNKACLVQAEIYRDLMQEADQDRVARLATAGRQAGNISAPQPACQPVRPGAAI